MCGSKGSAPTPSGASTTTSSNTQGTSTGVFAQGPSAAAAPLYAEFLSKAQALSNTPFNPGTMASVSPLNAQQDASLTALYNQGLDMGNFDPARVAAIQSPFTQNVVNATQGWFNNQNDIQSNDLLGQSIRSGNAFGGDRAGVAQAQMAGQQQLAQAPVIAGLYQSGYTQALDEYNKLKQFGIQGAEEAVKAGTVRQAQAQRELDVAQQNQMMASAYPFQTMNWYGSALGGIAPLTGTVGSAQTQSTASTEGISNPPTPNPLNQALGIGSSLIGIGGGLGLFKSGGSVGYGSLYDDEESNEDYGDGGEQQESAPPAEEEEDSEISKKTGKPKTDYERELEVIGKAGTPEPVPDLFGQMKIKKFNEPYSVLSRAKRSSGSGGGSSGISTGSTQPSVARAPQQQNSPVGGTGATLGTVAGAVGGGPAGAVVGNLAGRAADAIADSLKEGGPIRKYEDGEEVEDEGDEGDEGDIGDTGDTTIALPRVSVSAAQPPTTQVGSAAPAAAPAATPPGGEQPPSWLGPGVIAQPETRTGAYITKPGPGQRTKPEGPPEEQPAQQAGDRGYSVRRIPELAPRPKTFAERWASNPFTQLGAGMLSNTSPHFGPGLAAGVGAATSSIERNRRQDLLDAKPRMITSGDTVHALTGDLMIDTRIPTMTRAQSEANKRIKAHQDAVAAGKGGRQSSPEVMDRHIQTQLRMQAKLELEALRLDKDWGGRDANERLIEAQIRAAEKWNKQNPKYQVQVPERPVKPAEPEPEPAKPNVWDTTIKPGIDKAGPVLRDAWKGFTTDAEKGWNLITKGNEAGTVAPPATAAPAKPAAPPAAAPAQQPPAQQPPEQTKPKVKTSPIRPGDPDYRPPAQPQPPAQAPAQAQPQQQPQPPRANRIIEDLKSGKVTKEQLIEDARRAAAAGKDQNIINQKLKEAGIDPISIPAPTPRPNVPMSQ